MKQWWIAFVFISGFVFSQSVYSTPAGSKYHLASCRMVKNVSTQLSIDKAIDKGLMPCKICRPPTNSTLIVSNTAKSKAKGVNSKNRCLGITKSGTRCKRNTRIGNNYCFQHLK